MIRPPPADLAAILPDWELADPLTRVAALAILKGTFAAGYTDYDNDIEVRFGEEDVEWTETVNEVELSDFRGQLSEGQLGALQKDWTCNAITWHAAVSLCGELRRTCLRVERAGEVLLLSPEELLEDQTDRTFGPMWEGW